MKDHNNRQGNYKSAVLVSLALHIALVAVIVLGADFKRAKPEPSGNMVQAVVIDPQLVHKQAQQIREQREKASRKEQARLDKLRREAEELEKNRKAEEEQIRKLKEQQVKAAKAAEQAEQLRKQKEQERIAEEKRVQQEKQRAAKLEAERKAKEAAAKKAEALRVAKAKAAQEAAEKKAAAERKVAAERKAAAEKAAQEKAAKEKARRERIAREKAAKEAAAKKAAAEKAAREKAARLEQEKALNNIFSGLETESSQNSAARQRYVNDEVSRYSSIYTQLIESKLIKDDYLVGKECRVNIKLIPTGSNAIVSKVTVLSGNGRVCNAAKSAIAQVSSFPLPTDSSIANQLKDINLTVALE